MSNSTAVVPFQFHSHEIRTTTINGNPWFIAKDICDALDIKWQGSKSLVFLDEDEKGVGFFPTPRSRQKMLTISESGLFALILRSNKPEARVFRKWVTSEVLPAIHRTGGYMMDAQIRHRAFQAQILSRHLLEARPEWRKIIRYKEMGLNHVEIGTLCGRSTSFIQRTVRKLEVCGFLVPARNLEKLQAHARKCLMPGEE